MPWLDDYLDAVERVYLNKIALAKLDNPNSKAAKEFKEQIESQPR